MKGTIKGERTDVRLWADVTNVESAALDQLRTTASLPWAVHVCAMPDVHYGKGATVGSVVGMRNAVSPAAVGVDIGCGMGAWKTNIGVSRLPSNLSAIRSSIERSVPVGHASRQHIKSGADVKSLMDQFTSLHPLVQDRARGAALQIGTLGGGNHFIELHTDKSDRVWVVLHSGSRNIGKVLAEIHIAVAKKLVHNSGLPDPDLAVFLARTEEMAAYRRDLYWCQRYAMLNRATMKDAVMSSLREFFSDIKVEDEVLCHHNYVAEETHFGEELFVTRKGAINADVGRRGVIPGSMGTETFIVEGLGNADSLCSAPHGAGRCMSRGAARRAYSADDVVLQTAGVECRKDEDIVDEIPSAYKDIRSVISDSSDLVRVVEVLGPKPLLCVKG